MVEMPEGRIAGRIDGEAYIGGYVGSPMLTGRDLAFLPVIRRPAPGRAEGLSLQGLDLHTGAPRTLIEPDPLPFSTDMAREQLTTGSTHVDVAPSADGSSVLVVRDTGTNGTTTVLERFDAESGERLASRQWVTTDPDMLVWARLVPLDGANAAVVRNHVVRTWGVARQEWSFVDADLNELSSLVTGSAFECGFAPLDILAVTATAQWVILCSDPSGATGTLLIFLDERFRETARLELRQLGFALGATVMEDGKIAVVTDRPLVVLVDPDGPAVIEKRPVVNRTASLLDILSPSVALAKGPGGRSVEFSRDGNFAYVTRSQAVWVEGVALIDIRRAEVVAQSAHSGPILLSPDGGRLYVLTGSGRSARVVLLDPGTLREVAQSEPLLSRPFTLIAVAPR